MSPSDARHAARALSIWMRAQRPDSAVAIAEALRDFRTFLRTTPDDLVSSLPRPLGRDPSRDCTELRGSLTRAGRRADTRTGRHR